MVKSAAFALLSLAAADTCSLYQIADGSCGQSDLNCDYVKYAKAAEKGLADGTCADQGYTVQTGTQTKTYPIIGDIVITTYSKGLAAKPTKNIVELAQSVDDLSTLVAAVVAADLVDTLSSAGPFTVFAPQNEAFAALPAGTVDNLLKPENKAQLSDLLTYHVLPSQVLSTDLQPWQRVATVEGSTIDIIPAGNQVLVQDSTYKPCYVTAADNLATNGVAHIINGVLMPPAKVIPGARGAEPTKNIVELAQSVDSLSTLVSAVVAGDLVDTLSSPGPFTVFAPTNDAFAALPAGTLDTLLKPENKDQLVSILTYHVLPSQVLSTDLKPWNKVETVQGGTLEVIPAGKMVLVLDANYKVNHVVQADNLATNGVAHVIDGVLLPAQAVVV